MTRTSFNRLLEDRSQREVERALMERYNVMNLLWRRNAIIQAKSILKSQHELLPLHAQELDWKIVRVRKKLSRSSNPMKKRGYEAHLRRLDRRRLEFEQHIKNGTLPNVVFGGRGRVGSEGWRLKRRGQFLSVGDGWNKGNQNTRIRRTSEGFSLEVRNWPKGESFSVTLRIPKEYQRAFEVLAAGHLLPLCRLKTENGLRPYTIRVIKRSAGYACHVTFEVPDEPILAWTGGRLAAIDVNPVHIDIVIVSADGNLIAAKTFKEPALIYARKAKRLWLASNLVEKAFKWACFFGATALVVEDDLVLKGVEHGPKANRLIANFMHHKLLELIVTKALKRELILARVPAPYSSRVADSKYSACFPRMNVHQLAAFVLGRRALGLQERLDVTQLRSVAGPARKHQAWVKATFLHSHRHPYLTPAKPADGRIGRQDVKGTDVFDEWVTPRTRYAAKTNDQMRRLSYLVPVRHRLRRVEAIRDDGWTRAYGGNVPPRKSGVNMRNNPSDNLNGTLF